MSCDHFKSVTTLTSQTKKALAVISDRRHLKHRKLRSNQSTLKEERESVVNEIRDGKDTRCRGDDEIVTKSPFTKKTKGVISLRRSKSRICVKESVGGNSISEVAMIGEDDVNFSNGTTRSCNEETISPTEVTKTKIKTNTTRGLELVLERRSNSIRRRRVRRYKNCTDVISVDDESDTRLQSRTIACSRTRASHIDKESNNSTKKSFINRPTHFSHTLASNIKNEDTNTTEVGLEYILAHETKPKTQMQGTDKESSIKDYLVDDDFKVDDITKELVEKQSSEDATSTLRRRTRRRSSFRSSLIRMEEPKKLGQPICKIQMKFMQEGTAIGEFSSEGVKPIVCRSDADNSRVEETGHSLLKCNDQIASQVREIDENPSEFIVPVTADDCETRFKLCTEPNAKSSFSAPSTIERKSPEQVISHRQMSMELTGQCSSENIISGASSKANPSGIFSRGIRRRLSSRSLKGCAEGIEEIKQQERKKDLNMVKNVISTGKISCDSPDLCKNNSTDPNDTVVTSPFHYLSGIPGKSDEVTDNRSVSSDQFTADTVTLPLPTHISGNKQSAALFKLPYVLVKDLQMNHAVEYLGKFSNNSSLITSINDEHNIQKMCDPVEAVEKQDLVTKMSFRPQSNIVQRSNMKFFAHIDNPLSSHSSFFSQDHIKDFKDQSNRGVHDFSPIPIHGLILGISSDSSETTNSSVYRASQEDNMSTSSLLTFERSQVKLETNAVASHHEIETMESVGGKWHNSLVTPVYELERSSDSSGTTNSSMLLLSEEDDLSISSRLDFEGSHCWTAL